MIPTSTLVVVHTCGSKGLDVADIQRRARLPHVAVLPSPEAAPFPHGSHVESYLYRLGRPDDSLRSLDTIDSTHLRSLRDSVHRARVQQGTLHIIGVLDLDSPAGSRRALESLLRHTKDLPLPMVIHPGVWHATPKEVEYGLAELKTLLVPGQTELGSLFSLDATADVPTIHRFRQGMPDHISLKPEDVVVFINHDMHGQHYFSDVLAREYGVTLTALPHAVSPPPRLVDALSSRTHTVSAVSRPSYERAYMGDVSHPYYESYYHPRATELLEMLAAPHFHGKSDQLFVAVDAEGTSDFASLLRSFLQKQSDRTVVCCFVNPHAIDKSWVMSNIPLDRNGSTYHQINKALR